MYEIEFGLGCKGIQNEHGAKRIRVDRASLAPQSIEHPKHFYFGGEIVYVPDRIRVGAVSIDLERSISEDKANVDFESPQIDLLRRVNALRDLLFNLPKCSVMLRGHRDLYVAIRQWRSIRDDNHLIVQVVTRLHPPWDDVLLGVGRLVAKHAFHFGKRHNAMPSLVLVLTVIHGCNR